MERYRRIRRNGVDKKFLITFQNKNGENFFVNNKFKFIPITNKTSCEEIRTNAKWYSQRGAKVVVTKLWNNRSLGIKKIRYCTLECLEETFRIYRAEETFRIYRAYDIRC